MDFTFYRKTEIRLRDENSSIAEKRKKEHQTDEDFDDQRSIYSDLKYDPALKKL
jgi:hypothetical protein